MDNYRQGALLVILLTVVALLSVPGFCQQPRRRPRDRVIAAQDNIPVTNFSCTNRTSGYYADVETGCQVYHMCDGGRQFSYRCPDTTLFQQRMLICAHWYQVNCSRSEQHYSANLLIGQRDKPFVEESDYINIYFNGKGVKTLKNPEELQSLNNGNGGKNTNNQLFHTNKIINTNIAPTQAVFTNSNPSPNPHFSNKNFNSHPPSAQSGFTNKNPSLNVQFSNQNFKPHVSPTETVFTNTNPSLNGQFWNQNFKPRVGPTETVFTNTNPGFNEQFANQNFKPHVAPTETVFTNTNPGKNFQVQNQNFKPLEPISSPKPPSVFQTRSTTYTPFSRQVTTTTTTTTTTTPTPTASTTQKYESGITADTFSNQNINGPVVQTNEYNNFIKRFNPDLITEAIIKDTRNDSAYFEYNNFIKRFNPNESSTESTNQSVATFINSNFYSHGNFDTHNLEPPVPSPSSDIELPYDDAIQMESNNLELHFQDPRQAFFIPESDSHIIPAESATPITVNIRRSAGQQFHPMLFVNPVSDSCFKCHPTFVVDKANCRPCVVIR